MSPRPRREDRHPDLHTAIKASAWRQIAELGAPALNLRAIARDVGITAPSIYNYFPNRDALVTALIIDAYTDFGNSQLDAQRQAPEGDFRGRLLAVGNAYRAWAVKYPERYQLIFGTPIPGYTAPVEKVMPVAARSLTALVSSLEALRRQNRLKKDLPLEGADQNQALFEVWKQYGADVEMQSLVLGVIIWSRVHGLISLEVNHNLPPFGPSPEVLYGAELDAITHEFIKEE